MTKEDRISLTKGIEDLIKGNPPYTVDDLKVIHGANLMLEVVSQWLNIEPIKEEIWRRYNEKAKS